MGALFGFSGPPDAAALAALSAALRHRGEQGEAQHQSGQLSLGYRAAFGPAEQQRLGAGLHEEGGLVLALAGFVLGEAGEAPSLATLLRRYREQGIGFVESLRGAFVLALADGLTLYLVRDGVGGRTLYYGQHDGRLFFAIEPKGVLAAPGFPRRLRPAAVAQYLSFSFVPGSATMLEGLFELPAGHILRWDGAGSPSLRRTFCPEQEEGREQQTEAEWVARFKAAHGAAVAERTPPGPLALFLSGGLDSSVVAAELISQVSRPVRTYAIHFGEDYENELSFARAVAERLGSVHEEVEIRPEGFLGEMRRMVWHLDEPIGDPITMPNFMLAQRVDEGTRFVFNGEGGDPCFGGPKNLGMLLQHWYGGVERPPGFRERAYLASYRRAYSELDYLLTPEWRAQYDPVAELEGVLTPFFECDQPKSFLNKLMAINLRLKGAHLILPKVERMLAASGLVPLSPLFDERVVRLSYAMPPRMKLAGGVEKRVIKAAYADALPAEIIARPKSGMRVPVRYWLQGGMGEYARELLSERAIREAGIFSPERVQQLLAYNIGQGPGRYGLRLWMLITFELWRRMVLEGEGRV